MIQLINRLGLTVLGLLILAISSCEYQSYADADYPEQRIYMPAANYNPYEIVKASNKPGAHPTGGNRYRYIVDAERGKFIIPLGIYRAGIDNKGSFEVDISVNTDTITSLISSGSFEDPVVVLASERYTLPSSVTIVDGADFQGFNLEVDLGFLQEGYTNSPDEKYAIGVEISSTERSANPELNTTLIIIDTETSIP